VLRKNGREGGESLYREKMKRKGKLQEAPQVHKLALCKNKF
jgi:hypothetical protein